MTIDEARSAFPALERVAYLNAGTNGPLARQTVDAMTERLRRDLEEGRSSAAYFESAFEVRKRVRTKLAAIVGTDESKVALTTSTTNGCNVVVAGLGLGPDDEIVTTDGEHFGLLGALAVSPARVRIAAVCDLPPEQALNVLLAEVRPRTRLLALSQICWLSGNRFPVEELREQTGVPILVDGAQSAGAVPVDATRFDFFAFSGQKWLCGPDSTGGLVVAEPEALPIAAPSYMSQNGYDGASFTPTEGAARFDPGWAPPTIVAGLDAALDVRPEGGFERAAEMAERCRELLAERVEVITAPGESTLVSFRPEGVAADVVTSLHGRGVIVREVPGKGWIRVSCGWWTTDEDLERLVAGL